MIIQLTNSEFQKVRGIVANLGIREVTVEFNKIFNNSARGGNSHGTTGFVVQATNDIVINVPEDFALKVLSVVLNHASDIGGIASSPNIGFLEAPRILGVAQEALKDLKKAFS